MKRKSTPKAESKKKLESFFIPSIGRSVKAASMQESVEKAERLKRDTSSQS